MKIFKSKICGITRLDDAKNVAAFADSDSTAIGLNFYKAGKRYVDPETVEDWIHNTESGFRKPASPQLIGVFVNEEVDQLVSIAQRLDLNGVQLHGDESPEIVSALVGQLGKDKLIIRAVRMTGDPESIAQAQLQIDSWVAAGVSAILLDASKPGAYGGTGSKLDWAALTELEFQVPWVLAGGLEPSNVAQAISMTSPHAVDVASGVESSPGVKDFSLVRSFLSNAAQAFAQQNR